MEKDKVKTEPPRILFTQEIEQVERIPALKNSVDQAYLDFIEHRDNYQYFPFVT